MGAAIEPGNPSRDHMQNIEDTLVSGLRRLIAEGCNEGTWGDVRGTADALMVIGTCLPVDSFPGLRHSASVWLVNKAIKLNNNQNLNWEEEIWDTSVAAMGLCTAAEWHADSCIRAKNWLTASYALQDNWNDEPWESLWALLALYSIQRVSKSEFKANLNGVFKWLLSLCGKPQEGMLLNWHYTALFVLAANRYLQGQDFILDQALRLELEHTRNSMLAAIRQRLSECDVPGNRLWTAELWSNSLVLWSLAEDKPFKVTGPEIPSLLMWFERKINDPNAMTEDVAFACIALFHLHVRLAERCAGILEPLLLENLEPISELALKANLKSRLVQLRDYRPKPPLFSARDIEGYYTLHLNRKVTLLVLTLVITIALAGLSQFAGAVPEGIRPWAAFVPLTLGILAMVLQLLGIDLKTVLHGMRSADRDIGHD